MAILLTYDIKKTTNTINTELKNVLVTVYKYSATIQANDGRLYDLPNTCLKKEGITTQQASSEFQEACRHVGAQWEKYIAAEFSNSTFANQ
jgi:hypothetical protein